MILFSNSSEAIYHKNTLSLALFIHFFFKKKLCDLHQAPTVIAECVSKYCENSYHQNT